MNRLEAIAAVIQGKKVMHPVHSKGLYYAISLDTDDISFFENGSEIIKGCVFSQREGYEILKTKVKKSREFFIGDLGMGYVKEESIINPALSIKKTVHFKNLVTITWEEEE